MCRPHPAPRLADDGTEGESGFAPWLRLEDAAEGLHGVNPADRACASGLEAVDGTPVLDLKVALPALESAAAGSDTGWA
jgi:hypothetical protein